MSKRLLICTLLSLIILITPLPALAAPGNCVWYLRSHGKEVPQNPQIWAKYLPVASTELPPDGKVALIVTYESPYPNFITGHVRMATVENGKLINVLDSVNGDNPVEINQDLYKGFIYVEEVS